MRSSILRSAVLVAGAVAAVQPRAFASGADPFSVALPGRDTHPPEGVSFAGAGNVAEQQGAASYRFPIDVAPGRNGMAPAPALAYSSDGALRGGIAAGWSLDLPTIERAVGFTQPTYRLRLGGESQILVATPLDSGPGSGTRYRPERDDAFTHVVRSGSAWTVTTPDGLTRTFAGTSSSTDSATIWNLTSERDPRGNEVVYVWSAVQVTSGYSDRVLQRIEYSSNAAAGLAAHARINFTWANLEFCPGADVPKGAQRDHHFGRTWMRGSQRLMTIENQVRDAPGGVWRTARRVNLGYDTSQLSCGLDRPVLRYLTRIDTLAWSPTGVVTSAPPVRFEYGPVKRDLSLQTMTVTGGGPGAFGTYRGPEAGLMDLDGDGINDQVRVLPPPIRPINRMGLGEHRCRLLYRRGYFGGAFESVEHEVALPTAAWNEADGNPRAYESCTLNGQFANRQPATSSVGCKLRDLQIAYHFRDWDGDGDLDLLTGAWTRGTDVPICGDFPCLISTDINTGNQTPQCQSGETNYGHGCQATCAAGTEYNDASQQCEGGCQDFSTCAPDCDLDQCDGGGGGGGGGGNPGGAGCTPDDLTAEPGTDYTWRVWPNQGNPLTGVPAFDIATPVELDAMPAPLPLVGGELAPPSGGPSQLPGTIDIDGDGWLDLIKVHRESPSWIEVWRGLGDNAYAAPDDSAHWNAAGLATVDDLDTFSDHANVISALRFADFNGDGLPDLIAGMAGTSNLMVAYNMDGSFAAFRDLGLAGPVDVARIEMPSYWSAGMGLDTGWRAETRQVIDLDDDGLPEVVVFTPPSGGVSQTGSQRKVYRLDGNAYGGGYSFLGDAWEPVERLTRAISNSAWYRKSDFVDVTGDGRDDLVTWNGVGFGVVYTDSAGGAPARLLTSIDNGRGEVTRFTYGVTTDPALVTTVGGRNQPRWVVRTIVVSSGQAQPDVRTSYHYATPVIGKDSPLDRAPIHFLGFASVTAERSGQIGDASSRTVRDYTYGDGSRLHREARDRWAGTAWVPVERKDYTWRNLPLLGGAVTTTQLESIVSFGYRADGSLAGASFQRETWTPRIWIGGSPIVHYEHTESAEGIGGATATPVHVTRRQFQVRLGQAPYAASDYRILETSIEELGQNGGTLTTLARTTTTYSVVPGLPIETREDNGSQPSRTVRTFNDATGVMLTSQRPDQVAAGSTRTSSFTYDAHQLFVDRTSNELGHVTVEKHDVATGALLRREGPNRRTVSIPGCVPGRNNPCTTSVYEPTVWTVDGFGRVLTRAVATEPAPGTEGYATTIVEWQTHDDVSIPNRRVVERLRDWGGTVRLRSEQHVDGSGRVIRSIEHTSVNGVGDAVTAYGYDAAGDLAVVQVPDVRVDNGATVGYTLLRDGAGRLTDVFRPDGSRQVTVHDGLETRTWVVSPVDGSGAETREVRDALGRLIEVRELDNPVAGAVATTRYDVDALDRVVGMIDAEGAETRVAYDQRGQRTSITRGTRVWTYAYDPDGNLTAETSPAPWGGLPADFLSTTQYDEIGRVKVHTPGRRGLSDARRQDLAADPVSYTYDAGPNGIGQLTTVVHARTSSTTPQWRIDYVHGLRGELQREQRAISITYRSPVDATQWVDRTYDATGALVDATWDDGTSWRNVYDDRGRIEEVRWLDPAVGYRSVATYRQSVAGPPRERTSSFDQRRQWTYDVMGRVAGDRIDRPSTGAVLAQRDYAYDEDGNLLGASGTVGGQLADAAYTYNRRGRVTAAQVSTAYDASFTYSASGNLLTASVAGAVDTPARNVAYDYGARDPQAVDRLRDVTTGASVASLGYDSVGNLTTRTVPGGTWQLTWDGDDQLREAIGPTGTESYYYGDGAERMVAIQPDGTVKLWFGESETHFAGGAQVRRWHHIAAGEPVARIENRTSIELQFADNLQNLALTTSASGAVTSSFLYGAFGELVGSSGAATHRRQWNGKESDGATGLHFYGYRSYDPLLMRWISADPLYRVMPDAAWNQPQRANLYAFSLNNPLRYVDPDGRDSCDDCLVGEVDLEMDTEATWVMLETAYLPLAPYLMTARTIYHLAEGEKPSVAIYDNTVEPFLKRLESPPSAPEFVADEHRPATVTKSAKPVDAGQVWRKMLKNEKVKSPVIKVDPSAKPHGNVNHHRNINHKRRPTVDDTNSGQRRARRVHASISYPKINASPSTKTTHMDHWQSQS